MSGDKVKIYTSSITKSHSINTTPKNNFLPAIIVNIPKSNN
ncbi:hypothetical protein EC2846750_4034 [Escherichia coli 2846750]|nr:hypothetical protein EC2871950_5284 [Escherichia coli 2871950]EMV55952.1 hypothetical protein EC2872000_3253 [Escherichia coli 2872000]EMZ62802.1 hypothetical protein EC2846750_4034 [Escherichia coli 2846750]ENE03359.1 hypothetical protein ECP03019043_5093 [Escherichia coli P0301904.3]ESS89380.1 hypothetical protein L343_4263 [Escherichia coli CE549]